MQATNDQITRVRLMLDCCDDWDEDEQMAVQAVLDENAALRKLADAVEVFCTRRGLATWNELKAALAEARK